MSMESYLENAALMVKISRKLAAEKDPIQLRKAAISIQQSRLVACRNVANECSLYGEFISYAIKAADDKQLTEEERKNLLMKYNLLKQEIVKGEKELRRKWAEKTAKSSET